MKLINELIKEFSPPGITRGGVFFLPYPKALAFIDEFAKNKLVNFGVEGFLLIPGKDQIMAKWDMIADFSEPLEKFLTWEEKVEYSHYASHKFLKELIAEGKDIEKNVFNFCIVSNERCEDMEK
ncbi:MAG: hypothetical protein M3Y08_19415 [Fibrobacterota bacterium]|nr:hypothetical protein [Fibrobacterota bacterium]